MMLSSLACKHHVRSTSGIRFMGRSVKSSQHRLLGPLGPHGISHPSLDIDGLDELQQLGHIVEAELLGVDGLLEVFF